MYIINIMFYLFDFLLESQLLYLWQLHCFFVFADNRIFKLSEMFYLTNILYNSVETVSVCDRWVCHL